MIIPFSFIQEKDIPIRQHICETRQSVHETQHDEKR